MPNNTIKKPQAPKRKKSICYIIYLLCTRAFRSRRHLRSFILTVQSEIRLQCTKFRSKTNLRNDSRSRILLFNWNSRHFVLARLFDFTVLGVRRCLFELKNENNTPEWTKIACNFVKIGYNGPEL